VNRKGGVEGGGKKFSISSLHGKKQDVKQPEGDKSKPPQQKERRDERDRWGQYTPCV